MRSLFKVLVPAAFLLASLSALITPIYAESFPPANFLLITTNFSNSNRVRILSQYLSRYNSPLRFAAVHFIKTADRYGLDWRLLPAIAGMESTFGKFMIDETYNPFGWGGGYIYFDSFEESIETVGRQLFLRFHNRTAPENIGPTYTPPNYVNWIRGVNYFMREMEEMEQVWGGLQVTRSDL